MDTRDSENLAKILAGEATAEEKVYHQQWLNQSPHNQQLYHQLQLSWRDDSSTEDFKQYQQQDWAKLESAISSRKQSPRKISAYYGIAATVSMILLSFFTYFLINKINELPEIIYNSGDSIEEILLADSSRVTLNENTQLIVERNFSRNNRRLKLTGEAYFDVQKNKDLPFIITAGETTTKVLGTAFTIDAREAGYVSVFVERGLVEVSSVSEKVQLKERGLAEYVSGQGIKKEAIAHNNFLAWKTGVIRFEGETLASVSKFLSRHYNVEILLDEAIPANARISIELNNYSVEEALKFITLTLDLDFKKMDNQYVIYPKK